MARLWLALLLLLHSGVTAQIPVPVWSYDALYSGAPVAGFSTGKTDTQLGISGTSFTFSGWFLRPSHAPTTGDQAAFGNTNSTGNYPKDYSGVAQGTCLHLIVRSNTMYFGTFGNDCNNGQEWPIGTWNHVAWVYNVSRATQSIYLNGREVVSCGSKNAYNASGILIQAGAGFTSTWFGSMQYLRIFNTALTASQLAAAAGSGAVLQACSFGSPCPANSTVGSSVAVGNPSMEDGCAVAAAGYTYFKDAPNMMPSWTTTGAIVCIPANGGGWGDLPPSNGSYYIALQGGTAGISQVISGLTQGKQYLLTVDAVTRPGYPSTSVTVSVNNNALLVKQLPTERKWSTYSVLFAAAGAQATISFTNTGPAHVGEYTVLMDNVGVQLLGASTPTTSTTTTSTVTTSVTSTTATSTVTTSTVSVTTVTHTVTSTTTVTSTVSTTTTSVTTVTNTVTSTTGSSTVSSTTTSETTVTNTVTSTTLTSTVSSSTTSVTNTVTSTTVTSTVSSSTTSVSTVTNTVTSTTLTSTVSSSTTSETTVTTTVTSTSTTLTSTVSSSTTSVTTVTNTVTSTTGSSTVSSSTTSETTVTNTVTSTTLTSTVSSSTTSVTNTVTSTTLTSIVSSSTTSVTNTDTSTTVTSTVSTTTASISTATNTVTSTTLTSTVPSGTTSVTSTGTSTTGSSTVSSSTTSETTVTGTVTSTTETSTGSSSTTSVTLTVTTSTMTTRATLASTGTLTVTTATATATMAVTSTPTSVMPTHSVTDAANVTSARTTATETRSTTSAGRTATSTETARGTSGAAQVAAETLRTTASSSATSTKLALAATSPAGYFTGTSSQTVLQLINSTLQASPTPAETVRLVAVMAQELTSTPAATPAASQLLLTGLAAAQGQLLTRGTVGKDFALLQVGALSNVIAMWPSRVPPTDDFVGQAVQVLGGALSAVRGGLTKEDAVTFVSVASALASAAGTRTNGANSSIQGLGTTMEGVVQQMVQGSFRNANSTQVVSVSAPNVVLTAAFVVAENTSQAVRAPPGLPLARPLPWELVARMSQGSTGFGLSGSCWTGLNPYGSAVANSPTPASPLGSVVSLSVVSRSGWELDVHDLQQPLVLALPITLTDYDIFEQMMLEGSVPTCRWWDEATATWKDSGCRLLSIQKDGAEQLCACTHLTAFAAFLQPRDSVMAVLGNLGEALFRSLVLCANVEVLSSIGLSNLLANSWLQRNSVIAFWCFMAIAAISFLLSFVMDLAIQGSQKLPEEGSEPSRPPPCVTRIKRSFTKLSVRYFSFFYNQQRWRKIWIESVIEAVAGARLGIDAATLKLLTELEKVPEDRVPELRFLSAQQVTSLVTAARIRKEDGEMLRERCEATYMEFCRGGLWRFHQWGLLFWAFHPLQYCSARSLHSKFSSRMILILSPLLCSTATSGYFYTTTGAASAPDTPAECRSQSAGDLLWQFVVVSVASAACADIPLGLLTFLESRKLSKLVNGWEERVCTKILRVVFFNLLGLASLAAYGLYFASFLANIDEASALDWMRNSFSICLLSFLLMSPAVKATVRALASLIIIKLQLRAAHRGHTAFLPEWLPGAACDFESMPKKLASVVPSECTDEVSAISDGLQDTDDLGASQEHRLKVVVVRNRIHSEVDQEAQRLPGAVH